MPDQRTYAGGRFALDIMGANAGFLKKFDGMQMEADIVSNAVGPANIPKKHVARTRWTPAKATIGVSAARSTNSRGCRGRSAGRRRSPQ